MGLLDSGLANANNDPKPPGSRQIPSYSVRKESRSLEAALACLGAIPPGSANC